MQTTKEPLVVFVMGITNSGKSTFLKRALEGPYADRIGVVEVGKEMRKRHDPDFFQGKGAMESTEQEALGIYREQLHEAKVSGKEVILVDGMPRLASQIKVTCDSPFRMYLLLREDDQVITDRIQNRDGQDPKKLALSTQRFVNDRVQLYDVLTKLLQGYQNVQVESLLEEFEGDPDGLVDSLFEYSRTHRPFYV